MQYSHFCILISLFENLAPSFCFNFLQNVLGFRDPAPDPAEGLTTLPGGHQRKNPNTCAVISQRSLFDFLIELIEAIVVGNALKGSNSR